MKHLLNKQGKMWLNVASSIYVLENFVNLDNHLFLWLLKTAPALCHLLPRKYSPTIQGYQQALNKATLLKHDCRRALPFPDESADHILCSHFLEHIYSDEAEKVLKDFHRVARCNGTIHIIVPDLALQIRAYTQRKGNALAADEFLETTILSKRCRPSLKYRWLEVSGGFGLQHRWMYDRESMSARIISAGFVLLAENDTPSREFRLNDGSLHLVARKIR